MKYNVIFETKLFLKDMFLDYFNNFLSASGFASYYGMDEDRAQRVIDMGRKLHEKQFNKVAYENKI